MQTLRRVLSIHPGEGRVVVPLVALFALAAGAGGLGGIAADTLVVTRLGARYLPDLYVLLGLVSLVVALGYGAGLGSLRRRTFLPGVLIGSALVLLVDRAALLTVEPAVVAVVWLSMAALGALLLTLIWTVAGTSLTARQAKRLFPVCTAASIVGAFVGSALAGPLTLLVGLENVLVIVAGTLLAAAVPTRRLAVEARHIPFENPRRRLIDEVRAGFDYTRRSLLLRLVAGAYVLLAVLFLAVSFSFLTALRAAYPNEVELAATLGLISAGVTVIAFVVSIAIATRIYARFGVATGALMLPLAYLAGFGLWFVQFTTATAIAVRLTQQVTQQGISNAAWSALFNVVPAERRPQVIAFMDGVPGQVGTSLAGVLLIAATAVLVPSEIFALCFVAAAACTVLAVLTRRRYGAELLTSLRAGLGEQVLEGGPGLADLRRDGQLMAQLRGALAAEEPATRRLAAELLGRLGEAEAVQPLMAATGDTDPEVRAAAFDALGHCPLPAGSAAQLAAALGDPSPHVRAAAVRTLASLDGNAVLDASGLLAADPSPAVRAETAVALSSAGHDADARTVVHELLASSAPDDLVAGLDAVARLRDAAYEPAILVTASSPAPAVRAAAGRSLGVLASAESAGLLVAALDDEAASVRHAAASGLAEREDGVQLALGVLAHGSARAQDASLAALSQLAPGNEAARLRLRAWSIEQLERASALRGRAVAVREYTDTHLAASPAGSPDLLPFLGDVLWRRMRDIEDRVLIAIAALGAPAASGAIRRSLRSGDADTRAQALEALEVLGDPSLARALVRLLEADGGEPGESLADALGALRRDGDRWIRLLAVRATAERLRAEWTSLVEETAGDTDQTIRASVDSLLAKGDRVPATDRTLDEIERMLFLRRVPLFGQLEPEDLQRIASTAVERLYLEGEALVRENELGDELVVIVDGSVEVVRGEGAAIHLLRTYTSGDYIGELAVLSDRPRSATVRAVSGDVRGLVIRGEALRAILRERPEAAMAMLASLAARIGTQ